jgi:hypothetical protein
LQNQLDVPYDGSVAAQKTKGTRGGWRPGAGRKPTLRDPVSFTGDIERTDMDALEAIAEERAVSVASLVRKAVVAYVKRQRRA